jgi:hypothetical protein
VDGAPQGRVEQGGGESAVGGAVGIEVVGSRFASEERPTRLGSLTSLWRLNPRSLAVRSEATVPSSPQTEGITGSLAAAGGRLWVGAGRLDRVSLASGRVDRVVAAPYPGPVQLAADAGGRILLASLGYQHPTYIARLDPRTGATLSHLTVPRSVSQPTLGGVIDGGAWVENVVGSTTSAWRLDLRTLRATKTSAPPSASSRIQVRVIDGILWVTEPLGQSNLSYCASPDTARPRAQLPLLRGDSVFLTADAANVYYTDVPVNAHSVKLEQAPIPGACSS